MAIFALFYSVSLLWVIIYALHRFWTTRTRQSAPGILPSSGDTRRRGLANLKLTLKHAYLRIDSTDFNDAHDRLAMMFAKGRYALRKRVALAFYDFGSVCGIFGMLVAIYLTASTMYWSLRLSSTSSGTPAISPALNKREFSDNTIDLPHVSEDTSRNAPVQLILPGVTLPLSHLPILILALFVCQVIHEAGHAITAAMESLPLLSVGASLTLIFPSAYVSLPSTGVETLTPRARLRVISSGAFHNLVLWVLLASISWLGLGSALWSCLGYRDIRTSGRVVVGINEASPLTQFLPVGAVITRLDDASLASTDARDPWSEYLGAPMAVHHEDEFGWCADVAWYQGQPETCCNSLGSSANTACFTADAIEFKPGESAEKCAPTLEVLRPDDEGVRRCAASADCHDGDVCITLREDQHITRIEFLDGREEKTVVWGGPLEELFEDVETGTYLPRWKILPIGLPSMFTIVFDYVSTLTLSLFLFNLLPLPFLDGSQFLDALADLVRDRTSTRKESMIDVELGASGLSGSVSSGVWTARYLGLKKGVQVLIGLMLAVAMLSAAWHSV